MFICVCGGVVSQVNNAMMYLNASSKNQVQNKSRSNRQEEIIKSRAEINELELKKNTMNRVTSLNRLTRLTDP